jgi:predicted DNA-binding antitoxin AbrB/MazE fold protein
MSDKLKAIFNHGAFVPQEPVNLPEGSEVELIVQGPFVVPPIVKNSEEQKRIVRSVVQRMKQNPIPAGAPRLRREELHERR